MGADHVPLGSRHCFVYLNERAAQQAQASNLKRSLEVVTIADEFQSQIEGLYDDKEVGEAISLMDHFVAPLVAPLPETIAKLLDTIFEQDASDELVRQQLYVYLQRVRNVTVGTYVPIANQHSTQSRDYTDWQKLCLMLEACCNKNDAAARHRAKLLLRYCIGVLEDNLVRKRNTPHNAILFAMLNHSSTMPLVKLHQSCLDAFGFAVQQEPRDLQLMETVQRIVHLGYCVYSLTSLGSSVRYGGELAERLISAPKSLSIAFAQTVTSMALRLDVLDEIVQKTIDPATYSGNNKDIVAGGVSISKVLSVYLAALPKYHDKRTNKRFIDYYVALNALLLQTCANTLDQDAEANVVLKQWSAKVDQVRQHFARYKSENAATGADVVSWELTLDLLEATYV